MKIELQHPVPGEGGMRRHLEGDTIDWTRRVVWLADGRWVPFENIVVGAPDKRLSDAPLPIGPGITKIRHLEPLREREAHVCGCGRVFPSPQALGGHQRFCKGS